MRKLMRILSLVYLILSVSCITNNEKWPMPAGPNGDWIVNTSHKLPKDFSVTLGKNHHMEKPTSGRGTKWYRCLGR